MDLVFRGKSRTRVQVVGRLTPKGFRECGGLEPTGRDGSGGREGSDEGRSGDTEEEEDSKPRLSENRFP